MLRSFLIYLSKAAWAQRLVTSWKFAWRAASRFVAGSTVQDAIRAVTELNAKGINATVDVLGEATTTPDEALKATRDILELLDQINASQIRANVSVKLTQIGLALDKGLCEKNLEQILSRARQYQNFVRIDMEDTPYTDGTIGMYKTMHRKKGAGYWPLLNFWLAIALNKQGKNIEARIYFEIGQTNIIKARLKAPLAKLREWVVTLPG